MAAPKVFTRDATGLVRAVSIWDAFWYNNFTAGGAFSSMLWLSLYPIWFPQANLVLALGLTAIYSTLFLGTMYVLTVIAMPRSGSDYVFVSRTLGPAIGLGFSLMLVFWILMINAFNVYLTFGFLSESIWSLGAMLFNPSIVGAAGILIGHFTNELITGLFILIITSAAVLLGMRRYMKYVQRFVVAVSIVAFIIILGVVLTSNASTFPTRFNIYVSPLSGTPDPYHDVLNLATSLGYTPSTGFSWNQTVAVSVLWWFICLWLMSSAWIGGEVKQAKSIKLQFVSMAGGQVFTLALAALFVALWDYAITRNWMAAFGYILVNDPSKIPSWLTASAPYYQNSWVNLLMGNPILAFIVSLAWVLQCALVITPLTVATSRHIFAWSFDRVIPAKFSEVSERIGSPVFAVATVSVVIIVGYIFTLATTYLNFAVAAPMGVMFAFEFVAIATIVFKWRRKEIYNFSTLRDLKFLGIPLQPLIGVLSLITLAVMIGYYFGPLNGLVLGGLALPVTEISAGLVVAGILLYYVSQAIQQRRGVSVALAFKEIPPE